MSPVSDRFVAVVTGAAGAIGLEIARQQLEADRRVIMRDRSERVRELAAEFRQAGCDAESRGIDLASRAAAEELSRAILASVGRVDVLVNNAGIHLAGDGGRPHVEDIDAARWDLTIAVNLTAPFILCGAFLPGMKANGWGQVVNIASRAGRSYSAASAANYSASKAGMIGMTRAMAGEYARHGVTVNAVASGRTEPLMHDQSSELQEAGLAEIPRGVIGRPEEVAVAVTFLASAAASNLVGAVLGVNGGAFMP